jgi:NAD+ kinase
MKIKFKHLAIIGKYNAISTNNAANGLAQIVTDIADFSHSLGIKITIEADSAQKMHISKYPILTLDNIGKVCDCALIIGGDGTMLGAARQLAQYNIPLIGINKGRLGFITDISLAEYRVVLQEILFGHFKQDYRSLISAKIIRANDCIFEALALNDVVVSHGTSTSMVEMRIEINGSFVTSQRADGLIVATPTGSTAYALSAGGPILHPEMNGWVVIPLAPHLLTNRPIVIPNSAKIAIKIVAGREANCSVDTQSFATLQVGDSIEVMLAQEQVQFLHPENWNYFDTLREKLHWNRGV